MSSALSVKGNFKAPSFQTAPDVARTNSYQHLISTIQSSFLVLPTSSRERKIISVRRLWRSHKVDSTSEIRFCFFFAKFPVRRKQFRSATSNKSLPRKLKINFAELRRKRRRFSLDSVYGERLQAAWGSAD